MKQIFMILLVMVFSACNAQQKEEQHTDKKEQKSAKPVEKSVVHREYDEFGNLIKYDSIYSWSYSNIEGDSLQVNLDSIMYAFKDHFESLMPLRDKRQFRYYPRRDSLFMQDFFKEDYYFKNWEDHQYDFEKMMKKMDSLRNKYLKERYPGLMESNTKKSQKKI